MLLLTQSLIVDLPLLTEAQDTMKWLFKYFKWLFCHLLQNKELLSEQGTAVG